MNDSPFRLGTRTDRIYSTLLAYGETGIEIKTLIAALEKDSQETGVANDVRAKLSVWTDVDKNPHAKKFMVVTDKEPRKGRPKKEDVSDRHVAIILKDQSIPAWATWSLDNTFVPWSN